MNPYPADVVMARMALLFPLGAGTQIPHFITAGGAVYVEQKYAMSQGTMPSCLLEAGPQLHMRNSQQTHIAQLAIKIGVYDRWDQHSSQLDTIRQGVRDDIKLLMSILQTNESLAYGGQALATSIPRYQISAYGPETDEQFLGLHLVCQFLTATVNVLPYE